MHFGLNHDIEKKLRLDDPVRRSEHSPSLCLEKAAENVAGETLAPDKSGLDWGLVNHGLMAKSGTLGLHSPRA